MRSIRLQLFAAFAAVAVAVGAAGVVGTFTVSHVAGDVAELEDIAGDSLLASGADHEILGAMLNIREFLATSRAEDVTEARNAVAAARDKIAKALTEIQLPERRARIEAMARDIESFSRGIDALTGLVEKRNALVAALMTHGTGMRTALSAVNAKLTAGGALGEANTAGQALEDIMLARIYKYRFLATNSEDDYRRVTTEIEEGLRKLEGVRVFAGALGASAEIREFDQRLAAYRRDIADLHRTIIERNRVRAETLDRAGAALTDNAGKVVESAVASFDRTAASAHEDAATAKTTMFAALTLGFLIAAGLAFWLGNGLSRPIGRLTETMRRLAADDTNVTVEGGARKDEIGAMAQAVEVFRTNAVERKRLEAEAAEKEAERKARNQAMESAIANFQTAVDGIIATVEKETGRMQVTATGLGSTATRAREEARSAASASTEAAGNIQTVAAAAEELASSISEIARQVSGATNVVRKATGITGRSTEEIEGLATAASRIGDVVGLIQAIAEQTNLLALNATIEAARAGDAGRGFAVVAQEVKALAGQTAKATGEISTQIGSVQASTRSAVDAIREIMQAMHDIENVTAAIAAAVEEQGAATKEISQNVQMVAQSAAALDRNVASVASAIDETEKGSVTVRSASGELTTESTRLAEEIRKFFYALRTGPMDRRQGDDPNYRGPERRHAGHPGLAHAGGERRARAA